MDDANNYLLLMVDNNKITNKKFVCCWKKKNKKQVPWTKTISCKKYIFNIISIMVIHFKLCLTYITQILNTCNKIQTPKQHAQQIHSESEF